jgi:hypothetical protein
MLEWLKGKVKQGLEAGQKVVITKTLGVHFAPLEKVKGGIPGIADRLAKFVVDAEDESAVRDLAAQMSAPGIVFYRGGERQFSKGMATLLKLLPDDPEMYSRLASVYDAASRTCIFVSVLSDTRFWWQSPLAVHLFGGTLRGRAQEREVFSGRSRGSDDCRET